MSDSFQHRLFEIRNYFENGDYHLGYRRLLDAAIETNNFDVFAETLRFSDWYDDRQDGDPVTERVTALLTYIGNGYQERAVPETKVKLQAQKIAKTYARGN